MESIFNAELLPDKHLLKVGEFKDRCFYLRMQKCTSILFCNLSQSCDSLLSSLFWIRLLVFWYMLYNIKSSGIANRLTKVSSKYTCNIELGKIDNPLEPNDQSTSIVFKLVILICSYQLLIKKWKHWILLCIKILVVLLVLNLLLLYSWSNNFKFQFQSRNKFFKRKKGIDNRRSKTDRDKVSSTLWLESNKKVSQQQHM